MGAIQAPAGTSGKVVQTAKLRPRDGAGPAQGVDTAEIKAPAPAGTEELTEVVAKAKAAATAPPPEAIEEPSLLIPGVPTGKDLPVTVKAQITVKGTAQVEEMSDDSLTLHLDVRGHILFVPIERDITVSLKRQDDGAYLYHYKDNRSGETSEGVAKNITVLGNVRKLDVRDVHSDEDVPIVITDLGGGHFKVSGDGFEADINKT